jgi:hypothetical protein
MPVFDTMAQAEHYGRLVVALRTLHRIDQSEHPDYDKRYNVVLDALLAARRCGYEAGIRIDPKEPEWPVVFIELPTGQVSWHLPQHAKAWDEHTTDEKYTRIWALLSSE